MRTKLLPLTLLLLIQNAYAVDPPSAGSQLQQIPVAPQLPKAPPAIRVQQGNVPATTVGDTTRITVQRLQVTAPPVFPESELIAATGFVPGSELTLGELRAMASNIASYYQQRGYFLAQAYLPAQDIQDGVVQISVLPGQYGQVQLRNQSNLSDGLAGTILAGLDGQVISTPPLERRLLLLSDLPGVQVSSTLAPGASLGASDLIVEVQPGSRFNGSIDVDNQGNRYTGRNRIGATLNINELAGIGDVASVRAFTSADGLNYGRLAYQGQAGLLRLGGAYTYMDYKLGKEFAVLDAKGTAKIASAYGSYPLIRSRSSNLYAQVSYDDKTFQDRTESTGTRQRQDGQGVDAEPERRRQGWLGRRWREHVFHHLHHGQDRYRDAAGTPDRPADGEEQRPLQQARLQCGARAKPGRRDELVRHPQRPGGVEKSRCLGKDGYRRRGRRARLSGRRGVWRPGLRAESGIAPEPARRSLPCPASCRCWPLPTRAASSSTATPGAPARTAAP